MEREHNEISARIEADTRRLLTVMAENRLGDEYFTNVCVSGPNRNQPLRPNIITSIYTEDPVFRSVGVEAQAGFTGDQIRRKILSYHIRRDFLKRHKAVLGEFITTDVGSDSFGKEALQQFAKIRSETNGLPVFFFTFSKYESDGADVTHMYFPEYLMPDDLLSKVQQYIRDRAIGKSHPIL